MIKNYIGKLLETKESAKKLFSYLKGFKNQFIVTTLINILSYTVGIILAVITKSVIDNLSSSNDKFVNYLIFYLGISVILLFIQSIKNAYVQTFAEKLRNHLQLVHLERYFNIKYSESMTYHSGDILSRLTRDLNAIITFFTLTLPNIIALFLQLIIAFVIVFGYDRLLGIYGFLVMPLVAILSFVFGKRMTTLQKDINEKEGQYRGFLSEVIYNSIIIRCFQHTRQTLDKTKKLQNTKLGLIKKRNFTIIITSFIVQFGYSISSFIAFAWGAIRIQQGYLTIGMFFAVLQLMAKMQTPIVELTKVLPQYISTITSVERLQTFYMYDQVLSTSDELVPGEYGIKISSLSYSYNNGKNILEDFNLEIKPGEKIALIGNSGIGKTTLLKLLMGLLRPASGSIRLKDFDKSYDNQIKYYTYVPQGNSLMSGTIRDNLLIGNSTATEAEIRHALDTANALPFINELPKGLDSDLGEGGHGLSEGQLQRLCIARALVRKSPILLLDEATSSLDQETERQVLRKIFNNYPMKTVIAITHRPTLLEYVDRIVDVSKTRSFMQKIN